MEYVKLNQLVEINSGYAFKSALFNDSEGIPIVRIRDVNSGVSKTYYSGEYDEKYIINDEDMLISMDGSFIIKKWLGGRALLNQRVCRIKSKSNIILDDYIFRILPFELKKIEDKTPFVTVKHLSVKDINDIEIILPNINKQKNIVKVLDKAQELIDKRKEQIEALDELVKARFVEMFGDPVLNTKKWQVCFYEDICNCITDGEHSTPKRCENGIYLLSARNILNHSLQLNDVDFIDENEYTRISKRIIPSENDILISCSGSVGRVCKVPKNIKFQMVRSVAILKLNDNINATFMEWLVDSNYTQQQILKSINQSSQANLFQGKIRRLKAIVPPIELQNQFANFVTQVDQLKSEMEISLKELEDNFNSLMQKAFKGEIFN